MKGTIVNFRGSHRTQDTNFIILKLEGVNSKEEAKALIDKKLVWTTQTGRKISGRIVRLHGNKGAVRARFETNLPGQSIGTKVEVE